MEYRILGRTGLRVSALGLGTEYLQEQPRATVIDVVRRAGEAGVNYMDALFAPAGYRDNLGAALRGHRHEWIIAGHLGAAETDGQYRRTRDPRECEFYFHDLLERLQIDSVDILFLTNCDEEEDYRGIMGPGGLLEQARRYQRAGQARFIGFSGHQAPVSLAAVESGAVDVLLHPISLATGGTAEREALYRACVRTGVGLVAMKPFAGGELLRPRAGQAVTPVQCLAYTLSRVGVAAAIPGPRNTEELAGILAYLDAPAGVRDFQPVIGAFQQEFRGCVHCNHCLPCPAGIDIGQTIRLLVTAGYGLSAELRAQYAALPAPASACLACGACTERCPFGVDVIAQIEQAARVFER